jgi:hypothetical protein
LTLIAVETSNLVSHCEFVDVKNVTFIEHMTEARLWVTLVAWGELCTPMVLIVMLRMHYARRQTRGEETTMQSPNPIGTAEALRHREDDSSRGKTPEEKPG